VPGSARRPFSQEAERRFNVCPECGLPLIPPGANAKKRIKQLLDEESFEECFTGPHAPRPTRFKAGCLTMSASKAEQEKKPHGTTRPRGRGYIAAGRGVRPSTDVAYGRPAWGSVVRRRSDAERGRKKRSEAVPVISSAAPAAALACKKATCVIEDGQGFRRPSDVPL